MKINVTYWYEANFGDALALYMIKELTGKECRLKIPARRLFLKIIKRKLLIERSFPYRELKWILFPWQRTLMSIGSIAGWSDWQCNIWGAGFMNEDERFRGGSVYAVRGKYTNEKIKKSGFAGCDVCGDPALLLPLCINPVSTKKYKLGIIPHVEETEYFQEIYGAMYKIIDLRTKDIDWIVSEITSCQYVLSTSLHGIIVAHAYNIPALWIKKGNIGTDGFKFKDYFSSVNIECYNGFSDIDSLLEDESKWQYLFEKYQEKSFIHKPLNEIQINLLRVAPFPLQERYISLIKNGA